MTIAKISLHCILKYKTYGINKLKESLPSESIELAKSGQNLTLGRHKISLYFSNFYVH